MKKVISPLVSLPDHTTVIFSNNSVTSEGAGGALAMDESGSFVTVSFTGKSTEIFSNNATQISGALSLTEGSLHDLIFQGDKDVTFLNNKAKKGGTVYCSETSIITFTGCAVVNVYNNEALQSRVAILLSSLSFI